MLSPAGNRGFESDFLLRRVCKPSVPLASAGRARRSTRSRLKKLDLLQNFPDPTKIGRSLKLATYSTMRAPWRREGSQPAIVVKTRKRAGKECFRPVSPVAAHSGDG